MRVPAPLAEAFINDHLIRDFLVQEKWLPDIESLGSPRFLRRSILPHISSLSRKFNRIEDEMLTAYWGQSGNPQNLRLAYFLYFMPCNLFRVSSVWAELSRLGFRWKLPKFSALEIGAGPASGSCGILAGEKHASIGLPSTRDWGAWALIDVNRPLLETGARWLSSFGNSLGFPDISTRTFPRHLRFDQPLLPPTAPAFSLWIFSYVLNEAKVDAKTLADTLLETWNRQLAEDGLVIILEPALKVESRKLLELRKHLIAGIEAGKCEGLQLLLPCLGHQSCGALAEDEDWCHEEVNWWRPPYLRELDKMAGLDRRSLPFSYLVFARSKRTREELLPGIHSAGKLPFRNRLVSTAWKVGKDLEFFVCGPEGKHRSRLLTRDKHFVDRGDIIHTQKEPTSTLNHWRLSPTTSVLK